MALAATIDQARVDTPQRIGCFSYGSGCCSEFFSGVVTPHSRERLRVFAIEQHLNDRYQLSMDEYDAVLRDSGRVKFGTRDVTLDLEGIPGVPLSCRGKTRLVLQEIRDYHRKYAWLS
jgi:polyketide biosynthesis 3-hydroxy-3-methylglutaryl-CoA synthase-like enzyme PksG